MLDRKILLLLISGVLGESARGGTFIVLPDGTGDLPTIQQAMDVAATGDTIMLGDGVFRGDGNRDLDLGTKALLIRSLSLIPDACVLSPEGSATAPHRGFHVHTSQAGGTILQGFTITGGYAVGEWETGIGGAILCEHVPDFKLVEMIFRDNAAEFTGGAVKVIDSGLQVERCSFIGGYARFAASALDCFAGSALLLRDCLFETNVSEGGSGAVFVGFYPDVQITGSTFRGNFSFGGGGGIGLSAHTEARISSCLFSGNEAGWGGGIALLGGSGCNARIVSSTFYGNSAQVGWGSSIHVATLASAEIQNDILSFGLRGPPVSCQLGSAFSMSCSDVFGNRDGDYVGCLDGLEGQAGNIDRDPLFCAPDQEDFSIRSDSPCAEQNNPTCGQIGAFGIGCSEPPVSTRVTTWGAVKALFR